MKKKSEGIKIVPAFVVQLNPDAFHGGTGFLVSFTATGVGFSITANTVSFSLPWAGERVNSLTVVVREAPEFDLDRTGLQVRIAGVGSDEAGALVATLGIVGDVAGLVDEAYLQNLQQACQAAFFNALTGAAVVAGPGPSVHARHVGVVGAGAAGAALPLGAALKTVLSHRRALAAVAAVVALAVGFNVYRHRELENPLQSVLRGGDYADIQAKVREQIAAAAANPKEGAFGPLGGSNIAIDTLKAMNLDPGKAATGCLVGVK